MAISALMLCDSGGTARLVGTDADRIVAEVFRLLDDPVGYSAMTRAHNPFGDGKELSES